MSSSPPSCLQHRVAAVRLAGFASAVDVLPDKVCVFRVGSSHFTVVLSFFCAPVIKVHLPTAQSHLECHSTEIKIMMSIFPCLAPPPPLSPHATPFPSVPWLSFSLEVLFTGIEAPRGEGRRNKKKRKKAKKKREHGADGWFLRYAWL